MSVVFHAEKMKVNDFSFAIKLANSMHWDMTVRDFEFMLKLEPEGCFVLFHGGERFGIATSISYGKVGWLGNLIVREDSRRQGAGSILLQHVLDYLVKKGVETVGLYAYPHLANFYETFGFKSNREVVVLHGKVSYNSNQLTFETADKPNVDEIVNFDRQCFGADRKRLLKPIILEKRNLAYISNESETTTGYVLAKVQDKTAEIGPLAFKANNMKQALALLRTAFIRLHDFETFFYIPKNESELLKIAYEAGLKEAFRAVKMIWGLNIFKNCIYTPESLERG